MKLSWLIKLVIFITLEKGTVNLSSELERVLKQSEVYYNSLACFLSRS